MDGIVRRLFIYPVKSAAGIELDRARIDALGFRHDRRWMVVDPGGRFLTQREHPRLSRVGVAIERRRLVLDVDGLPPLALPIQPPPGPATRVVVWNDEVAALDAGADAARWITEAIGVPCRLVHMPAGTVRPVDPRYAIGRARVSFADAYPFLLLSEESLDGLNRRLATPVPVNRFRPNIVVRGGGAHAEDGWRRIRIRGIEFHIVKPCARCAITTVDQATAERGKEPLRTLATYRRGGNGKVLFGQNLIHGGVGTIRVGDRVEILETAATPRTGTGSP